MKTTIIIIVLLELLFSQIIEKQNKLLWDGIDWKNVSIRTNGDSESTFRVKSAYLNGVLDGRLYYYLKSWGEKQAFADSIYGDRVDYMTPRETIRQLDRFYRDNLMNYVPVVSAIIIVHMQAEQVPRKVIDQYVEETKSWINQLILDMQSRGMREIIKDKQQRSIELNKNN